MRARVPRSRVTHDRWLVSYADFITLLFGLFVVLFAVARSDQKKQVDVVASIDEAFKSLGLFASTARQPASNAHAAAGKEKAPIPMNIIMGDDVLAPARVRENLEAMGRELTQRLSSQVAQHTVAIRMGRDGLVISLREAGFFASGSAVPRPEAVATLRQVAASLGRTSYDLRVEGHTDNVPIHTAEFDSNWELSGSRATHIARMLLDQKLVSADRVSAAGYAEFHPVDTNATAEGRANNRRVDLVIMPRVRIEGPSSAPSMPTSEWHKITESE